MRGLVGVVLAVALGACTSYQAEMRQRMADDAKKGRGGLSHGYLPIPDATPPQYATPEDPGQPITPQPVPTCCVRCTKGKPCGSACIPWNHTCRVSGGCAC